MAVRASRTRRDVFTPEKLTDEHRLIAQTTDEFVSTRCCRTSIGWSRRTGTLARQLLTPVRRARAARRRTCPKQYGGLDLDKVTSLDSRRAHRAVRLVRDGLRRSGEPLRAAAGPLRHGGSEGALSAEAASSGEMVGAYALSESGSGSDALAAKTRAIEAGGRIAGVSTAKRCGSPTAASPTCSSSSPRSTATSSPRSSSSEPCPASAPARKSTRWASTARRRRRSSCRTCKVPAGNVLGEVGKGHKVALNTLNYGRFKLGGDVHGRAPRVAIGDAARYAAQRAGSSASRSRRSAPSGTSSARWRRAPTRWRAWCIARQDCIDAAPRAASSRDGASIAPAFEEYAIEASIAKVAGSEMLDFVLDENMQIHGGNGFVQGLPRRALLPRRARQPDLRGHQRDQPTADPRHAGAPRAEGRPAARRRCQGAAGRACRRRRRLRAARTRGCGRESCGRRRSRRSRWWSSARRCRRTARS